MLYFVSMFGSSGVELGSCGVDPDSCREGIVGCRLEVGSCRVELNSRGVEIGSSIALLVCSLSSTACASRLILASAEGWLTGVDVNISSNSRAFNISLLLFSSTSISDILFRELFSDFKLVAISDMVSFSNIASAVFLFNMASSFLVHQHSLSTN